MCPPGTELMWDGYSLLFVQGNEKAHGQDLGKLSKLVFLVFASLKMNSTIYLP